MQIKYIRIFTVLSFFIAISTNLKARSSSPLETVERVANKVIQESDFKFVLEPQKTRVGVQVVDFSRAFAGKEQVVVFAQSYLHSDKDTTISLGLSSSGKLKLRLNGNYIFEGKKARELEISEIAYNLFSFQDTLKVKLTKGANRILVKANSSESVAMLKPVTHDGAGIPGIVFSKYEGESPEDDNENQWLFIGEFSLQKEDLPPEKSFQPFYEFNGGFYTWKEPKINLLPKIYVDPENSYTRESYLDWHYANGALMLTFLQLTEATDDKRYVDFVNKYCRFIFEHKDYFEWQYENLHAFRGSYHRIFRGTMLDDTGAPALPFLAMTLRGESQYKDFVSGIADYVSKEQVRLPDGTLCRPEPEPNTVWADDLFMSVPFLLRMASLTGDKKYYDDVALQILKFTQYLRNSDSGLFYHGWFDPKQKRTVAQWGRANGWVAWAVSEALLYMPKGHPKYSEILSIHKNHMLALRSYQSEGGLWHQVLDKPESFLETSCSAMFTLAMTRGVQNGWLDQSFAAIAKKGWQGISGNIEADGTVKDICRGTGIGYDIEFYKERTRFEHDPRGLGAVIIAGIEVSKLED